MNGNSEATSTDRQSRITLVVIAASAGGLKALCRLLGGLAPGFPVPVVVLQHLSPTRESQLATILARSTALPVTQIFGTTRMEASHVYVAPPDCHTVLDAAGDLILTHTPAVNFVRPSADALFESAAEHCGSGLVAVVLTGYGRDGAIGTSAVRQHGGTVIAQDEATSENFGMPGSAIRTGDVDHILALDDIAPTLERLAGIEGVA